MVGCSDRTNSVGNNLIGTNEKFTIADTTLGATADTVFNVSVPNGYGATNVIGKTSDVESKAWLRFLAGALADSLRACTLDTVELHLTVSYTWNAPAAPAEYEIREALSPWSQGGITRDSLPNLQIGTAVIGRISQHLAVNDSIVVRLTDTTVIRRWMNYVMDATAPPMYGFVIVPKPGMVTGVFGYGSSAGTRTPPKLTIRFGKNGARDSLNFTTSEDTFIASANATTKPELEVRAGVSTWSKLKFDVSSLPQGSIINNATLELTQNSSSTLMGSGTPDSLYAYISKKGAALQSIDSTYRILGRRKDSTSAVNPVYVFTITPYVQFLISPGTPYDGIVLHAASNIASVDHMVFYSSKDPDAPKRPRLFITASKK